MNKETLLKHLVILMFFIFIADRLAQYFHWYYTVWYFDMIMHTLGGLWVGLFFIYFSSGQSSVFRKFILIILFVLLMGIFWEVFEYLMILIAHDTFDMIDTLSDIFFDLSGGLCAILYLWKKQLK